MKIITSIIIGIMIGLGGQLLAEFFWQLIQGYFLTTPKVSKFEYLFIKTLFRSFIVFLLFCIQIPPEYWGLCFSGVLIMQLGALVGEQI